MLRRRRLPVPPGGGGITSLIYVEDAAAATVAALERGRSGEAYNVADDEPVRWGEFFGALAKTFGAPPPREVPRWVFRFMPYARAMMLGDHRISNAKAKRELLWTPSAPTYREGISRLVQALGGACIGP
jgi:nucleoside-diphosphate-sugar epimerase